MSTAAEDPFRRQSTEGSTESESQEGQEGQESASSTLGAFRVCVLSPATLRRRAVDTSVDVDGIPPALVVRPPLRPPPPPSNDSDSDNDTSTTVESFFSSFWSTAPEGSSSSPLSNPSVLSPSQGIPGSFPVFPAPCVAPSLGLETESGEGELRRMYPDPQSIGSSAG
jgi:hypothetical protein